MSAGTWLERPAPPHVCPRPKTPEGLPAGVLRSDRWQCSECRKIWTVYDVRLAVTPQEIIWESEPEVPIGVCEVEQAYRAIGTTPPRSIAGITKIRLCCAGCGRERYHPNGYCGPSGCYDYPG